MQRTLAAGMVGVAAQSSLCRQVTSACPMAEHASVELSELRDGPEQVMTWESKEFSVRAKGAAKGWCGETVVQKGVLESPFLRTTPSPLLCAH